MRNCLGLFFLFLLSATAKAEQPASKTSTLFLRGRVPASTTVEFEDGPDKKPNVRFNGSKVTPKVKVSRGNNHRKITVIHP